MPADRTKPQAALVGAIAIVATLAGTWLWVTMALAPVRLMTGLLDTRSHLDQAEQHLARSRVKAAGREAKRALGAAHRAAEVLGAPSPVLQLASAVPQIEMMLDEVPRLVRAAVLSARAATDTIDVATTLLRPEGPGAIIVEDPEDEGSSIIDIERVEEVGATIAHARRLLQAAGTELDAIDLGALPRRLRGAVTRGAERVEETLAVLGDAGAGFSILPDVLGKDSPRIYLIGMQNSAEARGTGGAMLQFALLAISEGKPTLPRTRGTVYNVDKNRRQITIDLPEDAWYVAGIPDAQRFGNSNWSPDWPSSARLMLDYAYASDDNFPQVDGFILVDPFVMQHLLPGIGRYQAAGHRITSKRAVPFVLYKAYASYPYPHQRRGVLRKVVDGFYDGLLHPAHATQLMQGMSTSVATKRMQIWLADPGEQSFVERMDWDGAIRTAENSDYAFVVTQNVGGNKLDYFVEPEHAIDVSFSGSSALVSTEVAIRNRVFVPQPRWSMGDSGPLHRPMVNLYVPGSARLDGVETDAVRLDTPPPAVWEGDLPPERSEAGKKVWPATLEIPPGETGKIRYEYTVPQVVRSRGGRRVYRLVVQYQPKVHPERLIVSIELPPGAEAVRARGFTRRGDTLVWDETMRSDLVLEVSWEN